MTVLLAAIGATGWLVAMAMVWRSDGLMMRMIQEVNAKSDPKAKIPLFISSWWVWDVRARHRQLYPGSEVHQQFRKTMVIFVAAAVTMAVCIVALFGEIPKSN